MTDISEAYFRILPNRCNEDVEMLHFGFPTTFPTVFFSPNKKMPNKHIPKPTPAWT